jgi:hypothetical protein
MARFVTWKLAALGAALCLLATAGQAAQSPPAPQTPPAESQPRQVEKPKSHQATGIVVALTDTGLILSTGRGKKKFNLSFVRNGKTRSVGTLNRNAKVVVHYHEAQGKRIADRINVLEPGPLALTAKPPAPKPKP